MSITTWLRDRIRAKLVPFGGTVSRPSDNDEYPVTIANEAMGGLHAYETLEDLADLHKDNLARGMAATVLRHTRPDDTVFERDTYILDPSAEIWDPFMADADLERISDIIGYDLSLFWKPLDPEKARSASNVIESQYADAQDYGRPGDPGQPAFQPPLISTANYQAGKKSDVDSSIIWSNTYDPTIHKYERQRLGENGNWGIPKLINATSYAQGDFIDNRFIWVDKNDVPTRPVSIIGGKSNSEPDGWSNTPEVPGGADYYEYIEDHDLFKITASKDTYGNLKSEWSTPIKVSTDPNLVRYGNKPSSSDFIAEGGGDTADWRGYYTPGTDTHMATRIDSGSSWTITKIDGEDGEYVDWIFKAFPLGYEPDEDDRPTINNPFSILETDYPNNGWQDAPFQVGDDEVLYRSTGRKYNNGELKPSGWAIPTRADGKDTIQVVIEPQGPANFKRDASGAVTPESIVLKAVLYRGNQVVTPDVDIRWFKGAVDDANEIIEGSNVGVSQYHTISGTNNDTLTIHNYGVTNSQLYNAVAILSEEDYVDPITILDVTDGVGILAVIESDSGFVYKNSEGEITFNSRLYVNGYEISPSDYLVQWYLGGDDLSTDDEITIAADDFDNKEILKLDITYGGEVYTRTETLVDITDAEETLIEFSAQDPLPPLEGDQVWTESPTGAVYMRISSDGGDTWRVVRVKGESGAYNGGFQKSAYKNSAGQPTATSLTSDLLPTGAGWTHAPTDPGVGEYVWEVTSFFVKNPANTDVALTSSNWTQNSSWSTAIRKTGVDGDMEGPPGDDGPPGWSPVLSVITRSATSEVLQVSDWVGGDGIKPAIGAYIGVSGFTADIASAKNIKGNTGDDANSRPMYYVNTGNKQVSPPATAFSGAALQYDSPILQVQNTWAQPRWFRVEAEAQVTNDAGGNDSWVACLLQNSNNSWPAASSATRVDMNYSRQDYVADPDFPAVHKIKMCFSVLIPAGESRYFRTGLAQTDGTASRKATAFVEAWGL